MLQNFHPCLNLRPLYCSHPRPLHPDGFRVNINLVIVILLVAVKPDSVPIVGPHYLDPGDVGVGLVLQLTAQLAPGLLEGGNEPPEL